MRATEYFYNNDILGMVLTNVQDVLKAHDLGLSIMAENEDYLDERYDEEIDNNRDATTDEIIEDAQEAFKAGVKLYATLDVPNDYEVVPRKATNLQSNFYVGQAVYFMKDNKIRKKYIFRIMLNETASYSSSSDYTEIVGENGKITMQHEKCNIYTLADKRYYNSIDDKNCVAYDHMEVKREGEFFATKEELVKHLMEEE